MSDQCGRCLGSGRWQLVTVNVGNTMAALNGNCGAFHNASDLAVVPVVGRIFPDLTFCSL